jgi:ABC-type sugar transport system ATPase subunit
MSATGAHNQLVAEADGHPEPVVAVSNLVKRFGDVEAVSGVSFSVAPGEAFAFLGPNGAGKSTTISILCTLLRPSAGRASVAGFDVVRDALAVRRRIGLVFQDPTLDDYLTAEENRGSMLSSTVCQAHRSAVASTRCWRWSSSMTAAMAWCARSRAG